MTTSAAQAALGPRPPAWTPLRIAWADVEHAPAMREVHDPLDTDEVLGLLAENPDFGRVSDLMLNALRRVCDERGSALCEAQACTGGQRGRAAPVGFIDPEGDAWSPLTLVQRDRLVLAVCEECSPSALYRFEDPA